MAINKSWIIFLFRWFVPSLIAFSFLILPDLVVEKFTNPLSANWLARIFFVVYLINPFVGVSKVFDDKKNLEQERQKYGFYMTDKNTLSITYRLAAIFVVISTSVVFFLGIGIFFPNSNSLIYIFPITYTISVILIALYGFKLEKES